MLEKVIALAWEAGKMLEKARLAGVDYRCKEGIGNYVTEADLQVQAFLQRELQRLYPEAVIIGEEGSAGTYPGRGTGIFLDPIDGTANFLRGSPYCCVSIGVVTDGVPELGVVYGPFTGECYSGQRGKGAWCNGEPIRTASRSLGQSLVVFGTPTGSRERTGELFEKLRRVYDRVEDIRNCGSAALDICRIASGVYDGFFELELKPWDYAAAACILTEAGGKLAFSGGGSPYGGTHSVAAAQREIFSSLQEILCIK